MARNKLIIAIADAYQGDKPDKYLFSHLNPNWEDNYQYLEETFDILLTPSDQSKSQRSLEDFLAGLSDVDPAPLDDLLSENDVDPTVLGSTTDKLSVLYYSILAGFGFKRVRVSMRSSDLGLCFGGRYSGPPFEKQSHAHLPSVGGLPHGAV